MIRRRFMNKAGEVKIIEFTISEFPYQAEEGMTWGEWVDSEYNTGDFINNGTNINAGVYNAFVTLDSTDIFVHQSDIILENGVYYIFQGVGGDN